MRFALFHVADVCFMCVGLGERFKCLYVAFFFFAFYCLLDRTVEPGREGQGFLVRPV